MSVSNWTTVGKSRRMTRYKPRKTSEEPEWVKRNRLAREEHVNPITGVKFNSAGELANDLYQNHYKTTEEAELIAGIRNTIKCKKTGAGFSNEYAWRKHRVENGLCPMAFCRCDCGSAEGLLSHLMKVHRKPMEVARKMCFMKGAPVSQGFTMSDTNLPKSKDPMAIMWAREKKKVALAAASRERMERDWKSFDPVIAEANHRRMMAKVNAKKAVADEIMTKYKHSVDPTKYTIENLLKLKEKLRSERE
jgi:hypothetical protein